MTDLSILMPVYNEMDTVERAIEAALEAAYPVDGFEIVVVEDGSTDGTRDVLRRREWPQQVNLVYVDENHGKGAGVRRALNHARGTYSVILDADLEYDPREIGPVLEPLMAGEASAVFGTRLFQSHSAYGFWYVMGNRAINFAANAIYNAWISDIANCFKAMPTDLFRSLDLREEGFAIETEIAARLLRRDLVIYEVPITYRARRREEGKKLRAWDGVRMMRTLIRCRFD